ncbi:MAG: lysylphosphatidylglycerol synthase domain-containing protein [Candidatus Cloacimonadaceae bacterium]|nr:flippase-like domain-containing protein [Candidatus Cloacimonadota bacterium]MDY0126689.1 lysylphosphatidylglycerol synthase domain-containing protein [Candidatus Cloacimonadaceae bacterium]MCB5255582.1 flippase-like domain-containing protein [Candidatus Cloacimonadota bacterium]MCK9177410.1 flippase-like domain-containing protein [Candidatus Cloacimonadota bacterium]MCK9241688.1 flippase-like domain-containing protein [Candidatus Cloacimonadota bacterium]
MYSRIHELIKREKSPRYKRLSYIAKALFTLLLLYLIFRRIDLASALSYAGSLPLLSVIGVFALSILRHYIQSNNWRCALHLNAGYIYNRRQVQATYLLALPLRFLIPGGHASFAKVLYLKNTSLLASIVATSAERLFMTWATWTFAAIAAFFFFPELSVYIRMALIVFAAFLPLWAALIMRLRPSLRVHLPAYAAQAPKMMLLQIANTLLMYLQYYIILNHLGVISAIDTWIGMGLTNVSNSIPITISGLGLREGFAIHFLEAFNFSSEQAVAATLSLFVFHELIPALIGSVVLFRSKRV